MIRRLRRGMLLVLAVGLAGTLTELILIEHHEDVPQLIPIALCGLGLAATGWNALRPSAASVRFLQISMALCLISALAGAGFHFRGAAEFQWELDPTQSTWQVFTKVLRVKSPPLLAPGVMLQLSLLGLVFAHRHPSLDSRLISEEE